MNKKVNFLRFTPWGNFLCTNMNDNRTKILSSAWTRQKHKNIWLIKNLLNNSLTLEASDYILNENF